MIKIRKSVYNKSFLPILTDKSFIQVIYGGAASGKSYGIAQSIIDDILDGDRNFLVIRKVGATLRDSVFALLQSVIISWNLSEYFKINKSDFTITCINGFKIICKGLDDPEKIKSITVDNGVLTDLWIEEGTELSEKDFDQLKLRLRGISKKPKRIKMSFNPISQLHWVKKRYFDCEQPGVSIHKSTYKDNEFLSQQDKDNIEHLKDIDPVYYQVYALGEWGVLGNLVYNNWKVFDFSNIENEFNVYYYGLDFGFTNDPTAYVKMTYKDEKIYVIDEFFEKGLTNDKIAEKLKEYGMKSYIYCDSAEPKSIRELQQFGIAAKSVQKGKDSVKHGIQWIRQKQVIIHPRCQNFINEIQTYKYREDKDGNVMNQPVDRNNHGLDAMRYALSELIRYGQNHRLPFTASDLGL